MTNNLYQNKLDNIFYKRLILIALIVIPLISGLTSLMLGKDINWDLKNYHYYNAYAFLEGRMDFDIAPAQLQTYYNPLLDLPFYLMAKNFPSWVAGFVLGFVHGFNLCLIFIIYWVIYKNLNILKKYLLGLGIVVVSGFAPMFLSELGNTMNDNLTTVIVLLSLYLLISSLSRRNNGRLENNFYLNIGFAGFILGLGVGMKPTLAIFALGTTLALFVFQKTWKNRLTVLFLYGIAGLTGNLISVGYWWWELWQRFGNPLFPNYNHIFKSTYFTTLPVAWSGFIPDTLWEYFVWPFIFTANSYRTNQLAFFDIRFALLYGLVIIWLLVILWRIVFAPNTKGVEGQGFYDLNSGNFLLLFFFASYIFWILESATYRFIIPLELLTPLCFLILLEKIISNNQLRSWITLGAVVLTFVTFKPFNWGRLGWTPSYFSIDASVFTDTNEPIVIMLGSSPISYVIPHFPSQYRFVRPEGNLQTNNQDIGFFADIQELLKEHKGSVYIFYNKNENSIQVQQSLKNLHLDFVVEDCLLIKVNTPDKLQFCSLSKSK